MVMKVKTVWILNVVVNATRTMEKQKRRTTTAAWWKGNERRSSYVNSALNTQLSPLPPCITFSRLNRIVNGGARSKPRDHPQHHRHMLNWPVHAVPPAIGEEGGGLAPPPQECG